MKRREKVCTDLDTDLIVKVNLNKVVGVITAVLGICGVGFSVLAIEGIFNKDVWWVIPVSFILGVLFLFISIVTFYGRFIPPVEYGEEPEQKKEETEDEYVIVGIRPISEFERLYTKVHKDEAYNTLAIMVGVKE